MQKPLYFENEGQLIAGTIHIPEGEGPFPGVIFCHGFTGNKFEAHFIFVETARRLAKEGIASLRFDFRGSGESEGEFIDMTPSAEISDAQKALHVLAERPEVNANRLGVVGLSLGGLVAACTTGREPSIKSTVLWSAVADMPEVFEKRRAAIEAALQEKGYVDNGGLKVGPAFYEDRATVKPSEEICNSNSALLIVHGTNDEAVPVEHAEMYFSKTSAADRKVKKFILDGADHTYNRVEWTAPVVDETIRWFKTTL